MGRGCVQYEIKLELLQGDSEICPSLCLILTEDIILFQKQLMNNGP